MVPVLAPLVLLVTLTLTQGHAPCPRPRRDPTSREWSVNLAFRVPQDVQHQDWSVRVALSAKVNNFRVVTMKAMRGDDVTSLSVTSQDDQIFVVTPSSTPAHVRHVNYSLQFQHEGFYIELLTVKINGVSVCEGNCGEARHDVPLMQYSKEVELQDWPWIAAVYEKTDVGLNFVCGGSLVSSKLVVSAGHCYRRFRTNHYTDRLANDLVVYLGRNNLFYWGEHDDSQPRTVSEIIVHPRFTNEPPKDHDLAVLVLGSPVHYTSTVRPVCLWDTVALSGVPHNGSVVGWGMDERGSRVTELPRMTSLRIVPREECLASSFKFVSLTSDNTFCAGSGNGSGPCNGDSGSGFFTEVRFSDGGSRWVLRGLVSRSLTKKHNETSGVKECDLDHFVVFTDLARFADWLHNITQSYPENIEKMSEDGLKAEEVSRRKGTQCLAQLPLVERSKNTLAKNISETSQSHEQERILRQEDRQTLCKKLQKLSMLILRKTIVKFLDKSYYFSSKKLSWEDAQMFCEAFGLNLASIETAEENLKLAEHAAKMRLGDFWLGGSNSDLTTTWTWVGTDRSLNFSDWKAGEPGKKSGKCLLASKSGWTDVSCDGKFGHVCELEEIC